MDASETSLYFVVLIASSVLLIVVGYFVVTIIRQQKRNKELYKSKILAEISTLEKERKRIAADLHDELGPVLSSVKLRMNCLDINSDEDKEELEKLNQHVDDIIKRMREISNDLMPSVLLRKGLVAAMKEFIENISKPDTLKIHFIDEDIPNLENEKAIHIYRMFQEIVHNTVKYSKASELSIKVTRKDKVLVLSSMDDGIGFDHTDTLKEGSGFGLRNLLSRTEVLNGEMFLDTKPGRGTAYIFEIPM